MVCVCVCVLGGGYKHHTAHSNTPPNYCSCHPFLCLDKTNKQNLFQTDSSQFHIFGIHSPRPDNGHHTLHLCWHAQTAVHRLHRQLPPAHECRRHWYVWTPASSQTSYLLKKSWINCLQTSNQLLNFSCLQNHQDNMAASKFDALLGISESMTIRSDAFNVRDAQNVRDWLSEKIWRAAPQWHL